MRVQPLFEYDKSKREDIAPEMGGTFSAGGRPVYHPKMMTKIVLFGYTQKWFSCREIPNMKRKTASLTKITNETQR
ncbi:hypothetical protein AJ85_00680 [Alkalihalobacillus alcalophilus ATCC 27647 = CGMCC 1.3604]|uniref:Transposase InsH N-terminal domain-containing protein n=1 Tax=Alkalihalobacillus alcalophilus ATCC 27647 = CGMCC 1.3604 TaxID=1218173 RepID=A0A4S4K2S5_ALKAL|nr:hypothetical protein AJ85_00680 [Alkalihalobacillus alcalophilus ATCC 27647 = CGMCC 1.3604]